MAKEDFHMVEAEIANDHNMEPGTIQIRSTDVDKMKKALGDRLTVKGKVESEPEAKKAPAAKNKVESEPEAKKAPAAKNKARSA